MSTSPQTGGADIPKGLIDAVASLVATGRCSAGTHWRRSTLLAGLCSSSSGSGRPELVAEAVRSLAARNLITTTAGSDEVQVRGDLGIALAFQHRSRTVLMHA